MAQVKILIAVLMVISSVCCQSVNKNLDGTYDLNAKLPLAGDDTVLSAIGSVSGLKNGGSYRAAGGGLALDNVNGHSLSLTGSHIPSVADQLAANARVNLVRTPDHDLNVNAFISKTMPNNPQIPSFNTHGGSVDYMFKNKAGASLGVAHTPAFQKTDYSAMGNLNLFRDRTSSLDLNAGMSRSFSPFIPKSSWEPSASFTFRKSW